MQTKRNRNKEITTLMVNSDVSKSLWKCDIAQCGLIPLTLLLLLLALVIIYPTSLWFTFGLCVNRTHRCRILLSLIFLYCPLPPLPSMNLPPPFLLPSSVLTVSLPLSSHLSLSPSFV